MSSHHIVRDQQEPALLIIQLELFPWDQLHSLLEWSPTVLCCESALAKYLEAGHKVDVALVEEHQLTQWCAELEGQQPVKVLSGKTSDFLDAGLGFLERQGHKAVNLLTEDRYVTTLLKSLTKWNPFFEVVIFTESAKIIVQKSPEFRKWLPASTGLGVWSDSEAASIRHRGFDSAEVKENMLYLCKSKEGEISINCASTPYMITEDW